MTPQDKFVEAFGEFMQQVGGAAAMQVATSLFVSLVTHYIDQQGEDSGKSITIDGRPGRSITIHPEQDSNSPSPTLGEIIESAKSGGRPDYDDLRLAVCALDALMAFDRMAIWKLAEAEAEDKKPLLVWSALWQRDENFRRVKTALGVPPKVYLGPNNDPDCPDVQERRRAAGALLEGLMELGS